MLTWEIMSNSLPPHDRIAHKASLSLRLSRQDGWRASNSFSRASCQSRDWPASPASPAFVGSCFTSAPPGSPCKPTFWKVMTTPCNPHSRWMLLHHIIEWISAAASDSSDSIWSFLSNQSHVSRDIWRILINAAELPSVVYSIFSSWHCQDWNQASLAGLSPASLSLFFLHIWVYMFSAFANIASLPTRHLCINQFIDQFRNSVTWARAGEIHSWKAMCPHNFLGEKKWGFQGKWLLSSYVRLWHISAVMLQVFILNSLL